MKFFNNFLNNLYMHYPKRECPNLYNEIYNFLNTGVYPERIKSLYQIYYQKFQDKNISNEERTNALLANPFMHIEIKKFQLKKKRKKKNI